MDEGRFRSDLFYRLHVFPIAVPPLRERGADVELLAQLFIDRYCARIARPSPELTSDCFRRLRSYHWPGNVRELENVIERAIILSRDGHLALREVLPLESFPPRFDSSSAKRWSARSSNPNGRWPARTEPRARSAFHRQRFPRA